jgi:hypothetical protein
MKLRIDSIINDRSLIVKCNYMNFLLPSRRAIFRSAAILIFPNLIESNLTELSNYVSIPRYKNTRKIQTIFETV